MDCMTWIRRYERRHRAWLRARRRAREWEARPRTGPVLTSDRMSAILREADLGRALDRPHPFAGLSGHMCFRAKP